MDKMFVANKVAVINEKNEILLVRDAGTNHSVSAIGEWDLPGGRMNRGESPRAGLDREIFEETGIDISARKAELIDSYSWFFGDDQTKDQIAGFFWLVKVEGRPTIELSNEHSHYEWYNITKKLAGEAYPFTIYFLKKLQERFEIPAVNSSILGHQGYGLIQLYHGHGKGKTTAGLGIAIRAAGAGKKVGIVYFDKGGDTHYSERAILDQIDKIDYFVTGRDRIDEKGRFDFTITQTDKDEAKRGLETARMLLDGEYDLVILDEINSTLALGMLEAQAVIDLLECQRTSTELILTGRDPHPELIKRAHLVTEMKPEKHYFYSGVRAREGLDY